MENIQQLIRYFVENLDMGEGTFFEKWKAQLAPRHPTPRSSRPADSLVRT